MRTTLDDSQGRTRARRRHSLTLPHPSFCSVTAAAFSILHPTALSCVSPALCLEQDQRFPGAPATPGQERLASPQALSHGAPACGIAVEPEHFAAAAFSSGHGERASPSSASLVLSRARHLVEPWTFRSCHHVQLWTRLGGFASHALTFVEVPPALPSR